MQMRFHDGDCVRKNWLRTSNLRTFFSFGHAKFGTRISRSHKAKNASNAQINLRKPALLCRLLTKDFMPTSF